MMQSEIFDFYFPLYSLKHITKNVKVGFSMMLPFEKLPRQIRRELLLHWEWQFGINNEFISSKRDFVLWRKASSFLHVQVKSNDWSKAIDESHKVAEVSTSILSFLYKAYFPVLDSVFVSGEKIKDGNRATHGSSGEYYYQRGVTFDFNPEYEAQIAMLSDILINPRSEIDKRVNNALNFFRLQTSIADEGMRYVLLSTCLESLLLDKNDRDYLRWRLAEKSAFLFSKNRKAIFDKIKKTYDKRSSYVHGSGEPISATELNDMENTTVTILSRVIELRNQGLDTMEKIDSYIANEKFRE